MQVNLGVTGGIDTSLSVEHVSVSVMAGSNARATGVNRPASRKANKLIKT